MPLSTAVPDSGSSSEPSLSWLTLTPGLAAATRLPGAGAVVTPAVRQRHHAAADVVGDLDRAPPVRRPAPSPRRCPSEPEVGRVVGMDLQRAPVGAAGERGQVVHPAVVGAQVSAADQHEPVAAMPQRGAQPGGVGDQLRRRQLDPARRGAQQLGQPRLQRAEVDAVRCGLESLRASGRRAWRRTRRRRGRAAASCRGDARIRARRRAWRSARRRHGRRPAMPGRRSPWPAWSR